MVDGGLAIDVHGFPVAFLYESVDSTMTVGRALVKKHGSSHCGILALARHQTAGRGRQGRVWAGDDTSFMATFCMPVLGPRSALSGYSLAVGVWIAEALHEHSVHIRLKWPNDLMARLPKDDRPVKIGGVLIEVFDEVDLPPYIAIGIGINLRSSPQEVHNSAALEEVFGTPFTPLEIARTLAQPLHEGHKEFLQSGGFARWQGRWAQLSLFTDEILVLDVAGRTVEGIFAGVAASGALLLRVQGELREVHSGHLLEARRSG
jgi:BirA family biotin operon repressor/biotin-[acetyl-CoA-carboxylase] ligase